MLFFSLFCSLIFFGFFFCRFLWLRFLIFFRFNRRFLRCRFYLLILRNILCNLRSNFCSCTIYFFTKFIIFLRKYRTYVFVCKLFYFITSCFKDLLSFFCCAFSNISKLSFLSFCEYTLTSLNSSLSCFCNFPKNCPFFLSFLSSKGFCLFC